MEEIENNEIYVFAENLMKKTIFLKKIMLLKQIFQKNY